MAFFGLVRLMLMYPASRMHQPSTGMWNRESLAMILNWMGREPNRMGMSAALA